MDAISYAYPSLLGRFCGNLLKLCHFALESHLYEGGLILILLFMLLSANLHLSFFIFFILEDFTFGTLIQLFFDTYRHLTQLARRGGTPLNFNFVEHHKVCFFSDLVFVVFQKCLSVNRCFVVRRQQLSRLLLSALRVFGIWMVSSFKHINSQHKYLEALLAYLHPVPKSNRRICKRPSWTKSILCLCFITK